MQNNEIDILDNINLLSKENLEINKDIFSEKKFENNKNDFDFIEKIENLELIGTKEEKIIEQKEDKKQEIKKAFSFVSGFIYFIKYITTSSVIFAVLLLTTNYSAYMDLAKAYIFSGEMKQTQASIINSVEAAQITDSIKEKQALEVAEIENKSSNSRYSIKSLSTNVVKSDYKLDIDIAPYENRIIIPKIGKNIPLVDVKNKTVSGAKELENIFMEELKKWVVRYPWSAKPGELGNSFIFWHSSNLPWIKWDYNEVFVLLDKLEVWDEIIIFYNQIKYIYKINNKQVISPGQVWILKKESNIQKLSLMTCWPIWTTLNRLIVSWEIVNKN